MSQPIFIVWFRQDLRLTDNPALAAAADNGAVLPVYILDDVNAGPWKMGGASRWWLHYSLAALDKSLGGRLSIHAGDAQRIIPALVNQYRPAGVYWNRCFEPWRIACDRLIKADLRKRGVEAQSFNASLLWEPTDIHKQDGSPYRVFTPYYRKGCLTATEPAPPLPAPENLNIAPRSGGLDLNALGLLPRRIRWNTKLQPHWNIGERGAESALARFIESGLDDYKHGRDFPGEARVSRLSPHLHFGEISPNRVWHAALTHPAGENREHFLSELGWREFSYYLLYHFPTLPERNFQPKFDAYPWETDATALGRWQQGQTGIPIVDAGMRELWQTGYMHNRVRMIVASLLVKNLRIDWRAGAAWFWDTLVDADLASNSASWQWVAGSGADAAPYFRIFNPVTQARKFDPQGRYIRRYVPELAALPDALLQAPWTAPADTLSAAGLVLGRDYPEPIVDLKLSRQQALAAYRQIKTSD